MILSYTRKIFLSFKSEIKRSFHDWMYLPLFKLILTNFLKQSIFIYFQASYLTSQFMYHMGCLTILLISQWICSYSKHLHHIVHISLTNLISLLNAFCLILVSELKYTPSVHIRKECAYWYLIPMWPNCTPPSFVLLSSLAELLLTWSVSVPFFITTIDSDLNCIDTKQYQSLEISRGLPLLEILNSLAFSFWVIFLTISFWFLWKFLAKIARIQWKDFHYVSEKDFLLRKMYLYIKKKRKQKRSRVQNILCNYFGR